MFLEEEINDNYREYRHYKACHDISIVIRETSIERPNRDWKGVKLLVREHQGRKKIVIPQSQDLKDGNR